MGGHDNRGCSKLPPGKSMGNPYPVGQGSTSFPRIPVPARFRWRMASFIGMWSSWVRHPGCAASRLGRTATRWRSPIASRLRRSDWSQIHPTTPPCSSSLPDLPMERLASGQCVSVLMWLSCLKAQPTPLFFAPMRRGLIHRATGVGSVLRPFD